jgi:hypothetical protein
VKDPLTVEVSEGTGELSSQLADPLRRERAATLDVKAERLSLDELHRVVAKLTRATELAELHERGVVDCAGALEAALEALARSP